jgi:NhaP-type Na+/H+ or K+/H+ antiporter
MVWDQLEPTPPHLSYLLISSFLIVYCLFATFVRNRLHLSEPPLALLVGILLGPRVLGWLNPNYCTQQGCTGDESSRWGWGDTQVQEISRVILGVQVFTVGVGLPRYYASKHWKSVGILLSKFFLPILPHVLNFVTSVLFLRRHIATCLLSKGTIFSKLGMYPKRVQTISHLYGYYHVS